MAEIMMLEGLEIGAVGASESQHRVAGRRQSQLVIGGMGGFHGGGDRREESMFAGLSDSDMDWIMGGKGIPRQDVTELGSFGRIGRSAKRPVPSRTNTRTNSTDSVGVLGTDSRWPRIGDQYIKVTDNRVAAFIENIFKKIVGSRRYTRGDADSMNKAYTYNMKKHSDAATRIGIEVEKHRSEVERIKHRLRVDKFLAPHLRIREIKRIVDHERAGRRLSGNFAKAGSAAQAFGMAKSVLDQAMSQKDDIARAWMMAIAEAITKVPADIKLEQTVLKPPKDSGGMSGFGLQMDAWGRPVSGPTMREAATVDFVMQNLSAFGEYDGGFEGGWWTRWKKRAGKNWQRWVKNAGKDVKSAASKAAKAAKDKASEAAVDAANKGIETAGNLASKGLDKALSKIGNTPMDASANANAVAVDEMTTDAESTASSMVLPVVGVGVGAVVLWLAYKEYKKYKTRRASEG